MNFEDKMNVLIVFLLIVILDMILCSHVGNVIHKTCTIDQTFKMIFGKSFPDCIDECQRRQRCEVVMYKHGINQCDLKDYINITALAEDSPVCMFTNKSEWNRREGSPCMETDCEMNEVCVASSTEEGRPECLPSECPKLTKIRNAILLSNMLDHGSRNAYKCKPGFIGIGNPFTECRSNSTWTSNIFVCGKHAPPPTSNTDIAELISVTGEKWLTGTSVTYKCKPHYQGMGDTFTSVVDENGKWKPPRINCCNENITQFLWLSTCEQVFNGSLAVPNSRAGMAQYCKQMGGWMRSLYPSIGKKIFELNDYSLILSIWSKARLLELLSSCLTQNNVQIPTNPTYESLAAEVSTKGLSRPWYCPLDNWFAPGEPNGGESEDCLILRNGTLDIVDVSCTTFVPEHITSIGFACYFVIPQV